MHSIGSPKPVRATSNTPLAQEPLGPAQPLSYQEQQAAGAVSSSVGRGRRSRARASTPLPDHL